MAIPRASSGMLRSQIRPASRRAAPHLRAGAGHQVRNTTKVYGKDDLGGPGGQEPRPSKQAGPETIKRNWYGTTSASADADAAQPPDSLESIPEGQAGLDGEEEREEQSSSSSRSASTSSHMSTASSAFDSQSSLDSSSSSLPDLPATTAQPTHPPSEEYVSFPKLTTPTP